MLLLKWDGEHTKSVSSTGGKQGKWQRVRERGDQHVNLHFLTQICLRSLSSLKLDLKIKFFLQNQVSVYICLQLQSTRHLLLIQVSTHGFVASCHLITKLLAW